MEQMKKCKRCGEDKLRSEFYTHARMADGLLSFCKTCVKSRVKRYRAENLDYINWYDRKRAGMPWRRAARRAYAEHNQDIIQAAKNKWGRENRDKTRAQLQLRRAVISGEVEKKPCDICKCDDVQAHHPDYTKPLEVVWLCPKHHAEMHVALRDANRPQFQDTKSKKTKHLIQAT